MRVLVASVAACLFSSLALAAEPPVRPAELKELDRLVGTWKMAEFVSKKSVWTPEEVRSSGNVATTKWIMNDWFLEDRTASAGGAEHLGIWHFDRSENAYHYTMFLAPGGGRMDLTLHWDEKAQAFKGVGSLPNGVTMRTETRFPDKDTKEWTAVATDAAGVVYQDMKAKEVRTAAK